MTVIILDPTAEARILRDRRASGNDRWDEVWDGTYIFMPNPNIEHQGIVGRLLMVFGQLVEWPGIGRVFPGVNVSDRSDDWTRNYRCPDIAVYLDGNPAENRGAYWLGGPDLAVEIVSPDDRSREKLQFYASVGVRELLVIDRDPWAVELHRRRENGWELTGRSTLDDSVALRSAVLPLEFRLSNAAPRPMIEVARTDGSAQSWSV